jgi:hypothetical protein
MYAVDEAMAPPAGARPECRTHAGACAESNAQHLNMLRSSVEEACSTKLSFILSASCFLQCDQTSVKREALHCLRASSPSPYTGSQRGNGTRADWEALSSAPLWTRPPPLHCLLHTRTPTRTRTRRRLSVARFQSSPRGAGEQLTPARASAKHGGNSQQLLRLAQLFPRGLRGAAAEETLLHTARLFLFHPPGHASIT